MNRDVGFHQFPEPLPSQIVRVGAESAAEADEGDHYHDEGYAEKRAQGDFLGGFDLDFAEDCDGDADYFVL